MNPDLDQYLIDLRTENKAIFAADKVRIRVIELEYIARRAFLAGQRSGKAGRGLLKIIFGQ
ncbi:MAG: hypothetical protein WCS42_21325 [Verrucomicrobiota bacterium]